MQNSCILDYHYLPTPQDAGLFVEPVVWGVDFKMSSRWGFQNFQQFSVGSHIQGFLSPGSVGG
jgi:hypothetical protein